MTNRPCFTLPQSGISKAPPQPPPTPLSTSDLSPEVPRMAEEKSQLTMKLDQAVDARQLAVHDVVPRLRIQLEQIFEPPTMDSVDLSQTVNSRVIIIHGPTGTGKSTVIPWKPWDGWKNTVLVEDARLEGWSVHNREGRVTISLAKEVRRRHGEVGVSTVGYHVSRDRQITDDTRLVYLTEAIGVFSLLNNRTPGVAHPLAIVIADEVHERTMYTQMIIGLARDQMSRSTGMVLILMSATVDMEELREPFQGPARLRLGSTSLQCIATTWRGLWLSLPMFLNRRHAWWWLYTISMALLIWWRVSRVANSATIFWYFVRESLRWRCWLQYWSGGRNWATHGVWKSSDVKWRRPSNLGVLWYGSEGLSRNGQRPAILHDSSWHPETEAAYWQEWRTATSLCGQRYCDATLPCDQA